MEKKGYSIGSVRGRLTEKVVKAFGAAAGGAILFHCEYIANLELHPADVARYSQSARRKRKMWDYTSQFFVHVSGLVPIHGKGGERRWF